MKFLAHIFSRTISITWHLLYLINSLYIKEIVLLREQRVQKKYMFENKQKHSFFISSWGRDRMAYSSIKQMGNCAFIRWFICMMETSIKSIYVSTNAISSSRIGKSKSPMLQNMNGIRAHSVEFLNETRDVHCSIDHRNSRIGWLPIFQCLLQLYLKRPKR